LESCDGLDNIIAIFMMHCSDEMQSAVDVTPETWEKLESKMIENIDKMSMEQMSLIFSCLD